jgi:methylase of polypeptide subunit release factors
MTVFKRNLTSELLEKVARKNLEAIRLPLTFLEIGCGDGNISRSIALDFPEHKYFASDISYEAIEIARKLGMQDKSCEIEFKVSDGFQAWNNKKFDLILCDISAINQSIAELSEWYVGVECNSGENGLEAIRPIISSVSNFLNPNGIFILPKISLSNSLELEVLLSQRFSSILKSERKEWPMPKNLSRLIAEKKVPNKGIDWQTSLKFGLEIAYTEILLCRI